MSRHQELDVALVVAGHGRHYLLETPEGREIKGQPRGKKSQAVVGDRVLVELGQRLQAQVRGHDLLARWAGDEFVVVLDGIGQREDAERVAHKLRQALQTPLAAAGGLGLGLSVGIALYPQDGQDVQTLLHHADQAMYEDKPAP